jgi:hypothetical protein
MLVVVEVLVIFLSGISMLGQGQSSGTGAPVPNLVNFAGTLKDSGGHPIQSVTGVTFSLYAQEEGGVPLWLETQTVQADGKGNYTVQLGATKAEGLPLELFTSSTARWLGVRINGGEEQPRVLLVSVPYALKAGDAATIGGLPPSAFVLAAPAANTPVSGAANPEVTSTIASGNPPPSSQVTTTGGTLNTIPLFTTGTNIQSSALSQAGTGTTTKVSLKAALAFPATGAATASAGKTSYPIDTTASAFNSSSHTAVGQTFQLKTEPVGNNTANPSAALSVLFGEGAAALTDTGLKIASNGRITFASGQTFPGTGTITGVTAGTGLAGGGTTGTVALSVDSTQVPFLNAANSFSTTQEVFSGAAAGLVGDSSSSYGVYGLSSSSNGVVGLSDSGDGVYGESSSSTGVVGESSSSTGVYGSSSTGYGVYGNSPNSYGVVGVTNSGNGVYGQVSADTQAGVVGRQENSSGNWAIYAFGNLGATGTKSSVVTVDNGTRQVALYAVESPGVWFEDYGSGKLVSGVATVKIDPAYAETVNTGVEYHVFLTPDGDCEGLYVAARTATGFEVRELHQGRSNVAFDYRVIALRRGYETKRLADVTNATPRATIETPRPEYAGSAAGTATAK